MVAPLPIDEAWVFGTLLLWARLGALFALSPVMTAAKTPATFVVLFTLAWAGLLASAHSAQLPTGFTAPGLALALMSEALVGALLGFALRCAFAAFAMAGQLLDIQMGFGMGTVYDPVTQARTPVIGSALALFAMALFFALDAHHAMVRGVSYSIDMLPPGRPWQAVGPGALLRPFGAMFTAGVSIVAPALFILLLSEVAMGVISRVLPQMNVFFVGIPAKILVGLTMLALTAQAMGPAMGRTYAAVFVFWDEVLR